MFSVENSKLTYRIDGFCYLIFLSKIDSVFAINCILYLTEHLARLASFKDGVRPLRFSSSFNINFDFIYCGGLHKCQLPNWRQR